MSRDIFHYTRLLKALSNLALNTSREGASTASLGNLFQCLASLIVKNFFLIPNLNLPSFSLKPIPLVLSLHALVKSSSPAFLIHVHSVLKWCIFLISFLCWKRNIRAGSRVQWLWHMTVTQFFFSVPPLLISRTGCWKAAFPQIPEPKNAFRGLPDTNPEVCSPSDLY